MKNESSISNSQVVVTGGVGFIGSHLARRLLSLGCSVKVIDNFDDYYDVNLKESNAKEITKAGATIIKKDLSEGDCTDDISDADYIVHLAAQPGISTTTSFEKYLKNNVLATQKLLESVEKSKKLKFFVNISTSSVYGKFAKSNEETAAKPASYYGVTKLAAEQLVLAKCRDSKFSATSLRLFSVYGPKERPDKFFTKYISACLNESEFPLFQGSEKHVRSFTFVEDIVDGIVKALENKEKCNGEIFNIGSDSTFTTGEAMSKIEEITGKKPRIVHMPPRAGDQLETSADIEKAKRLLGYSPKTSLAEGIKAHVKWVRS